MLVLAEWHSVAGPSVLEGPVSQSVDKQAVAHFLPGLSDKAGGSGKQNQDNVPFVCQSSDHSVELNAAPGAPGTQLRPAGIH